MFLIDRPVASPGLRADLAPRGLFGGSGDLIRAALAARPPAPNSAASAIDRPSQLDLALSAPTRRRKAS